ncbi:thiol:disulfide interchange protein [Longibacter salinarum]|uniref:Thiol:disulfide interchange protein n=1 Tax=Longibacter salinarum TaxID=1850348 RepID=A0A2A8D047_9BACT|nr:thioredoxin family protein [Longibacter salinarum]PEN14286.1 thiol:disulfide interchange protein [Longibacter salinarum]
MLSTLRFSVWVVVLGMTSLFLTGPNAVAQTAIDTTDSSPHSEASLASDVQAIAPGQTFTVALDLEMEPGWHSYWINPGDSGEPIDVDWSLPGGFTVGELQFPFPHRIDASILTSYGYSDRVQLLAQVQAPDDLQAGTEITISGDATWLICADVCLPASGTIERTFEVREEAVSASAEEVQRIETTRQQIPKQLDGWVAEASQSEGSYGLAFTQTDGDVPAIDSAGFFPTEGEVLDHTAAQPLTRQGDAFLMALQQSQYARSPVDTLRGVLVAPKGASWHPDREVRAIEISAPVVEEGTGQLSILDGAALAGSSGAGGVSLVWALVLAFAGGMLLNLMPCVFPVLSIKILGFADSSGDDPSAMRRHGWLFGAGVLVSMWILAGTLLGLRAAGSEIGWGFQLQSPAFVALMTLLFTGIGFYLLGSFDVGTSLMNWGGRMQTAGPSDGNRGAFLTGVLATVVATPCTAPFMGAALGVALASSTVGALAIFSMLGAGMATPYVALSMSPGLLEKLPNPGTWMETLKQAFAFPMFATAIWLVWVFAQQTGDTAVAMLLLGVLLFGVAAWILNRWSPATLTRTARVASRTVAAVLLAGGVALAILGSQSQSVSASTNTSMSTDSAWQSYSAAAVDSLRASGRPVFIDFTAAWCLTCQVNKQTVLTSPDVEQAFREKDVALVRADWTNRDAEITRALESHGRSGVPLYVYYDGPDARPDILPEVLTKDIVLRRLDGSS